MSRDGVKVQKHATNKKSTTNLKEEKGLEFGKGFKISLTKTEFVKMPCRCETCLMISTKNFFLAGPGLGTLKKPKYHYIVVGGLLVQELEPLKDLKAEKG